VPKTSVVRLSDHLRGLLYARIQQGNAPARTVRRAHMLLLAAAQQPVQTIAAMLHRSAVTVTQTCKRFLHAGLEATLYDRPRPGSRRKLDGHQAAQLVALACRRPPAGRDQWNARRAYPGCRAQNRAGHHFQCLRWADSPCHAYGPKRCRDRHGAKRLADVRCRLGWPADSGKLRSKT
jgi:Homeodomain-like domain